MAVFDYSKLATFIEIVPPLRAAEIGTLLSALRKEQHNRFADIPVATDRRHDLEMLGTSLDKYLGQDSIGARIARILQTARALKTALRRTVHTWSSLHGEADFDEVLLLNVLRESPRRVPVMYNGAVTEVGVFDLVSAPANLEWLRTRENHPANEKLTPAQQAIKDLVDDRTNAEGFLIQYLLPERAAESGHLRNRPQSVARSDPTDYWARVVAEDVGDELRDQEVLRAIRNWQASNGPSNSTDANRLLEWNCRDGFEAAKVLQFSGTLQRGELLRLLKEILILALDHFDNLEKNEHGHLSAVINLARLFVANDHFEEGRIQEVERSITAAMPRNLSLVSQIEYWLVRRPSRHSSGGSDTTEHRVRIATHIRSEFLRVYQTEKDAPKLVAALRPGREPFVLSWIIRRAWDDSLDRKDDPSKWSRAAKVLIAAAEQDARLAGQALAAVLGRGGTPSTAYDFVEGERVPIEHWNATFDAAFAKAFLRKHFARAMRALVEVPTDNLHGSGRALISAVIEYAREWRDHRFKAPE